MFTRAHLFTSLGIAIFAVVVACGATDASSSSSNDGSSDAAASDSREDDDASSSEVSVPTPIGDCAPNAGGGAAPACAAVQANASCSCEALKCVHQTCFECNKSLHLHVLTRDSECDCTSGRWQCVNAGPPAPCNESTPNTYDDDACKVRHEGADAG